MKFDKVPRSQLFFGQYQYCVAWHRKNVSVLRQLSTYKVLQAIHFRNIWASSRAVSHGSAITEIEKTELLEACEYLQQRPNTHKRIVNSHVMYIYTNSPKDFADLTTWGRCTYTEVDLSLPSGVVALKNPQHKYRTFFRDRWLSDSELKTLREYFRTRTDQFRLGPGFGWVINGRRLWLQGNHFVDHNEPKADLLINMAVPGIVKKTLPIVARN